MKKLLILSGKGGTGKTTTAAAFAQLSDAKALADCDVDAPNLHLVLSQTAQPRKKDFFGGDKAFVDPDKCLGCGVCAAACRFGALEIRDGTARVKETACEGCGVCVHVCPEKAVSLRPDLAGEEFLYTGERVFSTAKLKMGRGNSGKLVTNVKLALLKNAPDCPLAIIDGSPGIGCPVIASVSGMDLVLVVAEPSLSGISDLKRLWETAQTFQAKLAVCVNKWDMSPENTAAIEAFCRETGLPFLGKIPYDKTAAVAINAGKSIVSFPCAAGEAIREIYEKIRSILEIEKE